MELTPISLANYYPDKNYSLRRARDCEIAEKLGLFEKIKLSSLHYEKSGIVDYPDLEYNWFYNRIGSPKYLRYVISPDARIPNYSTSLTDALEILIEKGIKDIPTPACAGIKGEREILQFILSHIC